jgi:hypothetical protein
MDATALQDYSPFQLRRLLERLREGLYDPLAVGLLTADHDTLDARLQQTLWCSNDDTGAHLCICGGYGQGKSHTLAYIQALALQQGYVVSAINLDPREVPLHQFRQTYRALMRSLTFPPTAGTDVSPTSFLDRWRTWLRAQPRTDVDPAVSVAASLPAAMPHPFKAAITALALPTLEVPVGRRGLQQYRDYRPADFPWTLRRMLLGDTVPVTRLRPALKYRQVSFYRQAALAVDSHESFMQMTLALPALFRRMGYRGWVLLFDEGEAIIQGPLTQRARACIRCSLSRRTFSSACTRRSMTCHRLSAITPRPCSISMCTISGGSRGLPGTTSAPPSSRCMPRPIAGRLTAPASYRCSQRVCRRCRCTTRVRHSKPWWTSWIRCSSRRFLRNGRQEAEINQ